MSFTLWWLDSERETTSLSSPPQILLCLPVKAFLPCLGHSSFWYARVGSWQPSGIVKQGSWNLKHKLDRCLAYLVLVAFSLKTQTWSKCLWSWKLKAGERTLIAMVLDFPFINYLKKNGCLFLFLVIHHREHSLIHHSDFCPEEITNMHLTSQRLCYCSKDRCVL